MFILRAVHSASRIRPGGRSGGSSRTHAVPGRIQALPPGSARSASPSANPVGRREEQMPQPAVVRSYRETECLGVRRLWRRGATLVALAAAGVLVAPAGAGAQSVTGGAAPGSAPGAAAPVGPAPTANLYGRPAPRIKRFSCRSGCAAVATARPGSLVRLTGTNLKRVDEVIFLGSDGDALDDASVAPRSTGKRSLVARVPRTALSGRIAVALADGTRSPATPAALAVQPEATAPPAGVIDAEVQRHKVFFDAQQAAELSYVVGGTQPADVVVELIRGSDGAAIASWNQTAVAPGVPQTVEWDGT